MDKSFAYKHVRHVNSAWIIRLDLLEEGKLYIFHCCVRDFDGLLKRVKAMLNSLVFILQFTGQFGVRVIHW